MHQSRKRQKFLINWHRPKKISLAAASALNFFVNLPADSWWKGMSHHYAGCYYSYSYCRYYLHTHTHTHMHTNTHTRLTALFPWLPGWAGTRKVKPIWSLLKQETVSGSGISWAICKSAPCSKQITMPAPHHSSFLQAGCPSCCPTNSVKALKAKLLLLLFPVLLLHMYWL